MNQAWNDEDESKFADLKRRWIEANDHELEIALLVKEAQERDDVKSVEELDIRRRHQSGLSDLIWDDYLPLLRHRSAPNDDNA